MRSSRVLPPVTTYIRKCVKLWISCVADTPNTTSTKATLAVDPVDPASAFLQTWWDSWSVLNLQDGADTPGCLISIRHHLWDHSCSRVSLSESYRCIFWKANPAGTLKPRLLCHRETRHTAELNGLFPSSHGAQQDTTELTFSCIVQPNHQSAAGLMDILIFTFSVSNLLVMLPSLKFNIY